VLENCPADSRTAPPRKAQARTRISNGKQLLPDADGRTLWCRRLRDLISLHVADLGGDSNISEAERALVRRASVLIVETERLEQRFAHTDGAPAAADLDLYQRLTNSLRRCLETLGTGRRARDISPAAPGKSALPLAVVFREVPSDG
jgi:hypothetical protein